MERETWLDVLKVHLSNLELADATPFQLVQLYYPDDEATNLLREQHREAQEKAQRVALSALAALQASKKSSADGTTIMPANLINISGNAGRGRRGVGRGGDRGGDRGSGRGGGGRGHGRGRGRDGRRDDSDDVGRRGGRGTNNNRGSVVTAEVAAEVVALEVASCDRRGGGRGGSIDNDVRSGGGRFIGLKRKLTPANSSSSSSSSSSLTPVQFKNAETDRQKEFRDDFARHVEANTGKTRLSTPHIALSCVCVHCFKELHSFSEQIVSSDDMKRCRSNHKHLKTECWNKSRECALCSS